MGFSFHFCFDVAMGENASIAFYAELGVMKVCVLSCHLVKKVGPRWHCAKALALHLCGPGSIPSLGWHVGNFFSLYFRGSVVFLDWFSP